MYALERSAEEEEKCAKCTSMEALGGGRREIRHGVLGLHRAVLGKLQTTAYSMDIGLFLRCKQSFAATNRCDAAAIGAFFVGAKTSFEQSWRGENFKGDQRHRDGVAQARSLLLASPLQTGHRAAPGSLALAPN